MIYDEQGNVVTGAGDVNATTVNPTSTEIPRLVAGALFAWAVGGPIGAILGALIARKPKQAEGFAYDPNNTDTSVNT
jgi:hypothetical protein